MDDTVDFTVAAGGETKVVSATSFADAANGFLAEPRIKHSNHDGTYEAADGEQITVVGYVEREWRMNCWLERHVERLRAEIDQPKKGSPDEAELRELLATTEKRLADTPLRRHVVTFKVHRKLVREVEYSGGLPVEPAVETDLTTARSPYADGTSRWPYGVPKPKPQYGLDYSVTAGGETKVVSQISHADAVNQLLAEPRLEPAAHSGTYLAPDGVLVTVIDLKPNDNGTYEATDGELITVVGHTQKEARENCLLERHIEKARRHLAQLGRSENGSPSEAELRELLAKAEQRLADAPLRRQVVTFEVHCRVVYEVEYTGGLPPVGGAAASRSGAHL